MASKFGLCRSLRSLIFQEDCDIDSWYPRCYDLGDFTDFEDFIEDFKITKAESIIITYHQQLSDFNSMEEKVKLRLALFVIRRKLRDLLETIN
jgi:tubulin monoglycylase TTLL3/8